MIGLCYAALGAGTISASLYGSRLSRRIGPGPSMVVGFVLCGAGWSLASFMTITALRTPGTLGYDFLAITDHESWIDESYWREIPKVSSSKLVLFHGIELNWPRSGMMWLRDAETQAHLTGTHVGGAAPGAVDRDRRL